MPASPDIGNHSKMAINPGVPKNKDYSDLGEGR